MSDIGILKGSWVTEFTQTVAASTSELTISSPFVTREGTAHIIENLSASFYIKGHLNFITNLASSNQIQETTDPNALLDLANQPFTVNIYHLPRLHAKVYIADKSRAIITSGNLTGGGLRYNYEYGVLVTDPNLVANIYTDISSYAQLGAKVNKQSLTTYCAAVEEVQKAFRSQQASVSNVAKRKFDTLVRETNDELIRLRLAEGAMHTVFEKTILYLLQQSGPLSTVELYPLIQNIHPDLCDDTVDRIIDGKYFGKKWKHAVRTSQQQLKRKSLIELNNDKWQLIIT